MTLFLCGDVMTGRGVDQILQHPSGARIFEPHVQDAREYVQLAESTGGPIARPVSRTYIWGDALAELDRAAPDVRIVNLETSVTVSDEFWPEKGINYRMHPQNIECLTASRPDACALANNHVLDYGYAGLGETLDVLTRAGVRTAGAGRTLAEAQKPAVMPLAGGVRVVLFAFGAESAGIPLAWAAAEARPGIDLLPDLSETTAAEVAARIRAARDEGDIVVASIHWGSNWGYDVPGEQVQFAHWLIDAGVDVVHGHSSHHPRPVEVYANRLILYGCGDFLNDYEGIEGYEEYRDDLVLMYFAALAPAAHALVSLEMTPMQIRRLSVHHTSRQDAEWLRDRLERVATPFGSHIDLDATGRLKLRWSGGR